MSSPLLSDRIHLSVFDIYSRIADRNHRVAIMRSIYLFLYDSKYFNLITLRRPILKQLYMYWQQLFITSSISLSTSILLLYVCTSVRRSVRPSKSISQPVLTVVAKQNNLSISNPFEMSSRQQEDCYARP